MINQLNLNNQFKFYFSRPYLTFRFALYNTPKFFSAQAATGNTEILFVKFLCIKVLCFAKMLKNSDFMLKLRSIESKLSQKFHTVPFVWSSQKRLYITTENSVHKFYQTCFLGPLFTVYLTAQLAHCIIYRQFNGMCVLYVTWLAYVLFTYNTYILVWKCDVYLKFINGMILFGNDITGKNDNLSDI